MKTDYFIFIELYKPAINFHTINIVFLQINFGLPMGSAPAMATAQCLVKNLSH